MKLIDKLKDEFPGLNENMLLQFIEEARKRKIDPDHNIFKLKSRSDC